MPKKVILFCLIFLTKILSIEAQTTSVSPVQMKPAWQKLLLELSTTYNTVVKENQVDLDSSLIYVSTKLKLSRLQIAAEGVNDNDMLSHSNWFDQRDADVAIKQLNSLTGRQNAEQLILIGAFYAFEPVTNHDANAAGLAYLNKALSKCESLHEKELYLVAERLVGKILLKQQNLALADSIFKKIVNIYADDNNKNAQAITLQWWGLYMPVTATSTPGRLANISLATSLFQQSGNNEEQITGLINKSYLYLLSYKIDSANLVAKEAGALTEQIKFPYTHYVSAALYTVTSSLGKFGEPLKYAVESAENAETLKDSIGLPYFYSNVGTMYANEDFRPEAAIEWNLKSINCFLNQNEPCYLVLEVTANQLLNEDRTNEAFDLIQRVHKQVPPKLATDFLFYYFSLAVYYTDNRAADYQKAFVNLNLVDSIEKEREKNGFDIRKASIIVAFGNFYYVQKKYIEASSFYRQYLGERSNAHETVKGRAYILGKLIYIDSILGNKNQLLSDYKQFVTVMNENYRISTSKLAEELQVKYATEEKESQIKLLTQKDQLVQENFRQANLVKNITIAGILLSLIIAGLLYRQNKLKQKSNDTITEKNQLLERLVEEKEWLVKEIHHRVKNNLHTVICLLESQAIYLDNDALSAIQKSQSRIYAMSLIHQKLYQSDDLKVISMKVYLTEFIQYLLESFGAPENIQVVTDVDDIKLSAARAIPLGLIINESVSNSFKYAFPGNKAGKISVVLKQDDQRVFLTVADNGIGSQKRPGDELNSLGLELINGLTTDLRGNISFDTNGGTSIKLDFLIDPLSAEIKSTQFV